MSFCSNCGKEVFSGTRLCPYCNSEINPQLTQKSVRVESANIQPESTPLPSKRITSKNTILLVFSLVIIIFLSFTALLNWNANSMNVEMKNIETSYSTYLSSISVKITIAVTNYGIFPVTIHQGKLGLIINGIDLGSLPLGDDWYILTPSMVNPYDNAREFIVTYTAIGSSATSLQSTDNYNLSLILKGETACYYYRTLFETTKKDTVNMVPK